MLDECNGLKVVCSDEPMSMVHHLCVFSPNNLVYLCVSMCCSHSLKEERGIKKKEVTQQINTVLVA